MLYAYASPGGVVHDFLMYSAKESIETIPKDGLIINIASRETRHRKQATTDSTDKDIHLPITKAAVYVLADRVTAEFRPLEYIVFTDNLFTNPFLAQALVGLGIGICGTVRADAKRVPPKLKAIEKDDNTQLADNQVVHRSSEGIIDNIV